MSAPQNTRLGILMMILCCAIFASQDALSRHLGSEVNVYLVVMIRFWFFAAFVILLAARKAGGLRAVIRTAHPVAQFTRAAILIAEICLMVVAFVHLGLIETHAVFICYPLLVTALSGPILGEKVGWRRWLAVLVGFIGVLIILDPGSGVFSVWALLPFISALMFAIYGLLTRFVARNDTAAVSFFWTGIFGALIITPIGLFYWEPMSLANWGWLGLLCLSAVVGHGLMIKAYELAEASAIQPFAYFQLPFVSIIGLLMFNEVLRPNVVIGAVIVAGAGLFTLWRQRVRAQQDDPKA